jgi:diacylglycerol kinase family enzyme
VNEASAGLSGATVRIVGSLTKRLGPRLAFGAGAIAAILSHRPLEAAVEVDGERVYEGPVSMVVAANGCYFGAGMKVAPRARVDDGALEAVLVRGLSVPRLLWNLPSFYVGRHGAHPQVSFHAARCLEILPKASGAPIDLDGESVGGLPMRAEVLPGALELYAPGSASRAGDR